MRTHDFAVEIETDTMIIVPSVRYVSNAHKFLCVCRIEAEVSASPCVVLFATAFGAKSRKIKEQDSRKSWNNFKTQRETLCSTSCCVYFCTNSKVLRRRLTDWILID